MSRPPPDWTPAQRLVLSRERLRQALQDRGSLSGDLKARLFGAAHRSPGPAVLGVALLGMLVVVWRPWRRRSRTPGLRSDAPAQAVGGRWTAVLPALLTTLLPGLLRWTAPRLLTAWQKRAASARAGQLDAQRRGGERPR